MKIKKLLVANRSEVALRIIRTAKEMGIKTVAVYSDADAKALFVRKADEAYPLNGISPLDTYLNVDKIMAIAKESKADALHPGYGFLSEKAELSLACENAGIIFVGPKSETIRLMGDKILARECAVKAGVPIVMGTKEPLQELSEAQVWAKKTGYPVLLKAAAGGGGKGMRVAYNENELATFFERASSEAVQAFGDGRLFIEKFIAQPKHVEVQILADAFGGVFYLSHRECSTQRRHQKIIEEAPCVYLSPSTEEKMAQASLALVKQAGYLGVGTLEFLVEGEDFYFLEMNTRLQVEHTVTEEILKLDLVQLQILVAQNQKLTLDQNQLQPKGHAIQCRIYAEEPEKNFMPSSGTIESLHLPLGLNVRHECGVTKGDVVSIYYDPLLAKCIVWAPTREEAIQKMSQVLNEYSLLGVTTNLNLLKLILKSEEFAKSKIHTQYLDETALTWQKELREQGLSLAMLAGLALSVQQKNQTSVLGAPEPKAQAFRRQL